MDIEFVRSRFIKHFDGKTGKIYQPTITEVLCSQEQ